MKKVFAGILLVLLLSMQLTACGSKSVSESNVTREDLIGDWIVEKSDKTEYITLKEDGTYLIETVASMGFTMSSEYKWTFEDGVYTVNYEDLGVKSVYSKVTLQGDTLTIDNGEAQIVYKKR